LAASFVVQASFLAWFARHDWWNFLYSIMGNEVFDHEFSC